MAGPSGPDRVDLECRDDLGRLDTSRYVLVHAARAGRPVAGRRQRTRKAPEPRPIQGIDFVFILCYCFAMMALDSRQQALLEARALVLKALAHPTRIFIIEELSKGERCVHELARMAGADASTVSKHLAILRSARIVSDDKRGLNVYYNLRMRRALDLLDCIKDVLKSNAEEQWGLVQ